jgi:hypothetical protein
LAAAGLKIREFCVPNRIGRGCVSCCCYTTYYSIRNAKALSPTGKGP